MEWAKDRIDGRLYIAQARIPDPILSLTQRPSTSTSPESSSRWLSSVVARRWEATVSGPPAALAIRSGTLRCGANCWTSSGRRCWSLRRQGRITAAVYRVIERGLDLEEARISGS
jgi:hypothetical protein